MCSNVLEWERDTRESDRGGYDTHYAANTAPHCAQNCAPSRSSAWHWPQARRADTTVVAEAGMEALPYRGAGSGGIGIGRQRPSDVVGTDAGNGAAIDGATAIPSRPAICSASAPVS